MKECLRIIDGKGGMSILGVGKGEGVYSIENTIQGYSLKSRYQNLLENSISGDSKIQKSTHFLHGLSNISFH